MFDGVDLRLDEEIDAETGEVGDVEPKGAGDGFVGQSKGALPATEAQPFVDGVEHAVEVFDEAAKEAGDQAEKTAEDIAGHARPADAQVIEHFLFEGSPGRRVQRDVEGQVETQDQRESHPRGIGSQAIREESRQQRRRDQRFEAEAIDGPGGGALQGGADGGLEKNPAGDIDDQEDDGSPGVTAAACGGGAKSGPVDDAQQKKAPNDDCRPGVGPIQVQSQVDAAQQLENMIQRLQQDDGSAKGQQQRAGEESAPLRGEEKGRNSLEESQVDFPAVIDAVEVVAQAAVDAQQGIAPLAAAGIGQNRRINGHGHFQHRAPGVGGGG